MAKKKMITRKNPSVMAKGEFINLSMITKLVFPVLIERDKKYYYATIPDLRDARVKGRTMKEAKENATALLKAISLAHIHPDYLDDLEYLTSMPVHGVEVFTKSIKNMDFEFSVLIKEDIDDGGYLAHVPALSGCLTQGDTQKELYDNIVDVIDLCFENQLEKKSLNEILNLTFVELEEMEVIF